MSNIRRSHATKTRGERREYVNSVVGNQPEPTVETIPAQTNGTATPAEEAPQEELERVATRPKSFSQRVKAAIRSNHTWIIGLVTTVILGVASYSLALLISTYRETGEHSRELMAIKDRIKTLDEDGGRALTTLRERATEDRGRTISLKEDLDAIRLALSKSIEKLDSRIDRVSERIDQVFSVSTSLSNRKSR